MIDQRILKAATFGVALVLVAMLGWYGYQSATQRAAVSRSSGSAAGRPASRHAAGEPAIGAPAGEPITEEAIDAGDASETAADHRQAAEKELPTLRIGVIGATPERSEVPVLEQLPVSDAEMRREYREARDRSCRLIVAGAPVSPPQASGSKNEPGTYGRVNALTIGLEHDSAAQQELPAVTRLQIRRYFEEHRLSIQPVLYYDEQNRLYFGTDCQAAFFSLDQHGTTVKAEPMIGAAVERFRALGVVAGEADDALPLGLGVRTSAGGTRASAVGTRASAVGVSGSAGGVPASADDVVPFPAVSLGRTLAMASVFEKSAPTTVTDTSDTDSAEETMELLLLHLPPESTAANFEIQVFITSDERSVLHHLDTRDRTLNSPAPTITAGVRFDKMILLGMYPASPVVTGMQYRSSGTLSMDTIHRMTREDASGTSLTVTEILDQFGKLSKAQPAYITLGSDSKQAVADATRRKYEQLEEMRKSAEQASESAKDEPVHTLGGVELMTGVGDE